MREKFFWLLNFECGNLFFFQSLLEGGWWYLFILAPEIREREALQGVRGPAGGPEVPENLTVTFMWPNEYEMDMDI